MKIGQGNLPYITRREVIKMPKRRTQGEGSISDKKRPDGRYQGYVTVGYNPDTGTPKRQYFYGNTKAEVLEKMNAVKADIQKGTYIEPNKITVAQRMDIWINNYMRHTLRAKTWDNYNTQINKHIIPALGHLKLTQVKTVNIQKLYNDKLSGGRADGKQGGLSPKSIRYIHTVIHSSFQQAYRERLININPADAARLPRLIKSEMRTLDIDGMKKFLSAAKTSKHYASYVLELSTGLRRGELLGLRWKDIDLQAGTVSVVQNLVRTNNGLIFQEPKTKLSQRTINIPDNVVKGLKVHKAKQSQEKLLLGQDYRNNDLVFCNELGDPLDPRSYTRHFERIIERAGIEKMCFHDLRHTFATISLQEGLPMNYIQETLGHYSPAFTMSAYQHVTTKMKNNAIDKIGTLMAACLKE